MRSETGWCGQTATLGALAAVAEVGGSLGGEAERGIGLARGLDRHEGSLRRCSPTAVTSRPSDGWPHRDG